MEIGTNEINSACENDDPKITRDLYNDEYSIYNYCRDHTAFLIACISALVAVLSFVFDYAATLYNRAYFSFWKVDIIYSIQHSTLQLYTVFFAFMITIISSVISIIMSKTADVYRRNYEFIYIAKKTFCKDRKEIRTIQKKRRELEKKLNSTGNYPEVDEMRVNLQNEREEIAKIKKRFKNMKRKAHKYNLYLLAQTLPTVIFAIIVTVLVYMMSMMNTVDFEWGRAFYNALKIAVPTILFAFLTFTIVNNIHVREKYSWTNDFDELLADFKAPEPDTYPINKLLFGSPKTFASNTNIKMALVLMAFSSIACVFLFTSLGQGTARDKKDFPVYSRDGIDYAIIYNNGESAIMEKAIIDGNNIYIDTRYQQVTSAKEINFTIYSFENAFLINHQSNVSLDEETPE